MIDFDADPKAEIMARLAALNKAMTGCGGGVAPADDLSHLAEDGVLRLRLVGMCTGCSCRAVTTVSTLRPALEGIDGVQEVQVANSRISRHAEERMARAFAAAGDACLAEGGAARTAAGAEPRR